MALVLERKIRTGEAQIGFVHQTRCLQRETRSLASHVGCGNPPQFVVNDDSQLVSARMRGSSVGHHVETIVALGHPDMMLAKGSTLTEDSPPVCVWFTQNQVSVPCHQGSRDSNKGGTSDEAPDRRHPPLDTPTAPDNQRVLLRARQLLHGVLARQRLPH